MLLTLVWTAAGDFTVLTTVFCDFTVLLTAVLVAFFPFSFESTSAVLFTSLPFFTFTLFGVTVSAFTLWLSTPIPKRVNPIKTEAAPIENFLIENRSFFYSKSSVINDFKQFYFEIQA